MSTPTYAPPLPTSPEPVSQPAENTETTEKKTTGPRPYHIWEEVQDGVLHYVTTVEATSHENAVKTLGTSAVGRKFGSCPARNYKTVEPKLRPESVTF